MSVDLKRIEGSLVQQQTQINFAPPAGLGQDVVGSLDENGLKDIVLQQGNIITDVVHDIDPDVGLLYQLFIRRINFKRGIIGSTPNFKTTYEGNSRPGFPKAINPGFLNFVEVQKKGAATAQNYLITTVSPLVV